MRLPWKLPLAIALTAVLWLAPTARPGEPVGGASSTICDPVCEQHQTVICEKPAWAWFRSCWSRGEGAKFRRELNRRGHTAVWFRDRHPELARTFGKKWGLPRPDPFWKVCHEGPACAKAVIQHVFGDRWAYAYKIAGCETGWTYDAEALGAAGERGIFQIHPVHFGWLDEGRLWDVRYNARIAYRMSRRGTSWTAWTCSRLI